MTSTFVGLPGSRAAALQSFTAMLDRIASIRKAHQLIGPMVFAAVLVWALGAFSPAWGQPARTITVAPDGPIATLTEAVAQAQPGDRILLTAGTYREPTVVIDKPLTLEGQGDPVLDGEGERQLLHVRADSVTIRGLVLRNVGTSFVEDRAAIKIEESRGCVVEHNRIIDGFFGIWVGKSQGCRITHNTLEAHKTRESISGNGIHLWYCADMDVAHNTIDGHRDGIYFEFVEDSRITNNDSVGNLRYGLHFMYSDYCRYEGNLFRDNGAGVAVMFTRHVEMVNNRFEHNWGSAAYGLLLKDIYDSTVAHNTFDTNTIGIYSENSSRIDIHHNAFRDNGWGVKIMANSIDNRFTDNNFIGNSFDVITNSQQSNSTFAHNYWDKYDGYDLNRDGVGDVPFHPVRLFAYLVEQNEPAVILMRSLFVQLLDAAERVLPAITPKALVDERPAMSRIQLTRTP